MSSGVRPSVHLTKPHQWSAAPPPPSPSPWAAHVSLLRVNLYANGSTSCPLSAGARVGFPHSWCLTPTASTPSPSPPLVLTPPPHPPPLPLQPRSTIWSERLSRGLFVFAQLNQYQSAYVVFLITVNRFHSPPAISTTKPFDCGELSPAVTHVS